MLDKLPLTAVKNVDRQAELWLKNTQDLQYCATWKLLRQSVCVGTWVQVWVGKEIGRENIGWLAVKAHVVTRSVRSLY